MSNDAWEFKDKDDWIYIENISKTKVLVPTNDGKVILEVKDEDKNEHLWEKGVPNNDGYFTLQNASRKFMTAISPRNLGIKGNFGFVQPIFGFWSLLATKLRKYYVIFVYILQARWAKWKKNGEKIMQLK